MNNIKVKADNRFPVEDDDIVKKLLILLVLIGVGLVAGAFWLNSGPAAAQGQFTLQAIERGTLDEAVSATGAIQPTQVGAVGSEVPGQVASIDPKADFNQPVKKGQPLASLDKKLFEEKLTQARTTVEAAKADVEKAEALRNAAEKAHNRAKELVNGMGGFQKDLEQAEAQFKAGEATVTAAKAMVRKAEATRDEAQLALDKTVLSSPIDGVIMDKKIVVGQAVSPMLATPLFTIAGDLKQMEVYAQVTEGDVSKVRKGQKARFTVNAYPENQFFGTVREVRLVPMNVQGAVFYTAVVDVNNVWDKELSDWKLRPGMPAAVDIIRREHTDAWKIPTVALSFQLDPYYQTEAAKSKLARWQSKTASGEWKPVWILGADQKPWPIFVRTGGDQAIQDSQFNEALEWDPEVQFDPKKPDSWPRLIINAPPVNGKGPLDSINVRVF